MLNIPCQQIASPIQVALAEDVLVRFWDWRKITEVLGVWAGMVPTVPREGGAVGRMAAKQAENRVPRLLLVTAKIKARECFMGSPILKTTCIHLRGLIKAVCPQMPGRLLTGLENVILRDLLYHLLSDVTSVLYCCVTSGYACLHFCCSGRSGMTWGVRPVRHCEAS